MVWALAPLKSFIFGQMNEMNLERDLQMQLMELPEHEERRGHFGDIFFPCKTNDPMTVEKDMLEHVGTY